MNYFPAQAAELNQEGSGAVREVVGDVPITSE